MRTPVTTAQRLLHHIPHDDPDLERVRDVLRYHLGVTSRMAIPRQCQEDLAVLVKMAREGQQP